jgi:hypothetical protein
MRQPLCRFSAALREAAENAAAASGAS